MLRSTLNCSAIVRFNLFCNLCSRSKKLRNLSNECRNFISPSQVQNPKAQKRKVEISHCPHKHRLKSFPLPPSLVQPHSLIHYKLHHSITLTISLPLTYVEEQGFNDPGGRFSGHQGQATLYPLIPPSGVQQFGPVTAPSSEQSYVWNSVTVQRGSTMVLAMAVHEMGGVEARETQFPQAEP